MIKKKHVNFIIYMLFIISLIFLTYFIFENLKLKGMLEQTSKKKEFTYNDTLEILNLFFNQPEIFKNPEIMDTNSAIGIDNYPYIFNDYPIKAGDLKFYKTAVKKTPYRNQFIFDYFYLFPNDSANIFSSFDECKGFMMRLRKINNKWTVIEKGLGIF